MSDHHLILENRFWPKVARRKGPVTCWPWKASKNKDGYGWIRRGRRMELAHRMSWEINFGPIPDGQYVLHKCDNPACVRPSHLFLGDQITNMADMVAKGRCGKRGGRRGEESHVAKVTEKQVLEIRSRYAAGGISHKTLGKLYGLTACPVGQIIRRQTWSHI